MKVIRLNIITFDFIGQQSIKMKKILFPFLFIFSILLLNSFQVEKQSSSDIEWEYAKTTSSINAMISSNETVLFFKHSYKCGLSAMILKDFESEWDVSKKKCRIVFIDVLKNREISNYLSDITGIRHHSPQAIVTRKSKILYQATHGKIKVGAIKDSILN